MAHHIDERELRRLRRARTIEEEERQERLEQEILLLQRQRDQFILDQRQRRAHRDVEFEQILSDEGSILTIDQCYESDDSAFEADSNVRKIDLSQTKGILQTPSAYDGRFGSNADKGDSELIQSVLQDGKGTGKVYFETQGRVNRDSEIGLERSKNAKGNSVIDLQGQSNGQDSLSGTTQERPSVLNVDRAPMMEKENIEREQGSFLDLMDREILDLDRRLQSLRTNTSDIVERSKERMNSSTLAREHYSMESNSKVPTKCITTDNDRKENEIAKRDGSLARQIDNSDEGSRRAPIHIERDEYIVRDPMIGFYRQNQVTPKYESGNTEEIYEVDRRKRQIDFEIEKLMKLRGSLGERGKEKSKAIDMTDLIRKNIVKTHVDDTLSPAKDTKDCQRWNETIVERALQKKRREIVPNMCENRDNIKYEGTYVNPYGGKFPEIGGNSIKYGQESVNGISSQSKYRHYIHGDNEREESRWSNERFSERMPVGFEDGSKFQLPIEPKERKTDTYNRVFEHIKPERSFDADPHFSTKEEEEYFMERQMKEMLLKEKEQKIREKEIELREREIRLECQEKEKLKSVDPYDELLKKKEEVIEQTLLALGEREQRIRERERQILDDNEIQAMTENRSDQTLHKKNQEVDATARHSLMGNIETDKEEMSITQSSSLKEKNLSIAPANQRPETDTSDKTELMFPTVAASSLDRTFYFPKFSSFSGEESRSKKESSFEEWIYEVNCLRRDNIYSDAVIGQAIRKSLTGQAKKVLLTMNERVTVDEMLDRLEGVFGNVATPMSILQEFYTVSQRADESVTAWGLRLEEILKKAIEKGQVRQEDRDELLRNKFWRSLKNEKLKSATRLDFKTATSFDVLRKKVRAEEYDMKINTGVQQQAVITERKEATADMPESKMDMLLERLASLEKQMKEMNKRRQGRFRNRGQYQNQHPNQNQRSNQNTQVKSVEEQRTQQTGTPLN